MTRDLRELSTVREARAEFSWPGVWALFDGDEDHLNIAEECLDRHDPGAIAARVASAGGARTELTFGRLSRLSAQVAHLLADRGVGAGERVGVLMEPSEGFYAALFGVLKLGAVAVPLYALFGPDAVGERLADCAAVLLLAGPDQAEVAAAAPVPHLVVDQTLLDSMAGLPDRFETSTAARDTAVLQYTSGTSRRLPEAVAHDHRAVVTLAVAALFALGLRRGDRYFCPSSPAWGHGLWHGTIAPWSLGVAVGAYAGRHSTDRLIDALVDLRITNLAAAGTVYRMLLDSPRAAELTGLEKATYTGEPLSAADRARFTEVTGVAVGGMYGTTETGVLIADFPGFTDHVPRAEALGKPLPGRRLAVLDDAGEPVGPDTVGEIAVHRRAGWVRTRDLGSIDADGYYHYLGRADDVIISAGWTISPHEVERGLLTHPDVREAAVIGVPDATRGTVVKAFVVTDRPASGLVESVQAHVRTRLGPHEYPRQVEVVTSIPRTVNGKIDRRALRRGGPVHQEPE